MIVVECPLNSLSFGNVSFNILRELFQAGEEIALFPIGDKLDLAAFKVPTDMQGWLNDSLHDRWKRWDKDMPSLRLWHLMGSENRKTKDQHLFTFYECSEPTAQELAIASNQDRLIFSSTYSKELFEKAGVKCDYVPLGFDPDFKTVDVPRPDGIHFGLMGKFENRKHTEKIIQTWLKKYGNKKGYTLNLCITNPFFKPEQMQQALFNCFGRAHYSNVNVLPYLQSNSEVNSFLNVIDIDLGGLSGGEGWNLPSFNATCLGKWSIVLNATSHKDWATKDNSILVEPSGTIEAYDDIFFKKGAPFNQGVFFDWNEDEVVAAMETAETRVGQVNTEGVKMSQEKTYANTVSHILSGMRGD